MVFQPNVLENAYFIAKMPGLAMVRLASSDMWKAPLKTCKCNTSMACFQTLLIFRL